MVGTPAPLVINTLRVLDWLRLSPLAPWHYLTYHKAFYFDVSRARRELDWVPRYGNQEALKQSYDWFVAHAGAGGAETRSTHRKPVQQRILRLLKGVS